MTRLSSSFARFHTTVTVIKAGAIIDIFLMITSGSRKNTDQEQKASVVDLSFRTKGNQGEGAPISTIPL